jgi:hypothetical protein
MIGMILPEVALLGKIQSRCDGVGSEANGGKPSVNRPLRGTVVPVNSDQIDKVGVVAHRSFSVRF